MGLPWVRLDSNINQNEKVLRLLREPQGYRAFTVYICGLGWCGNAGSDGDIPQFVLPLLHGQPRHAEMLVQFGLWEYGDEGWHVHNWMSRQEAKEVTERKRSAQRKAARKTNCERRHVKGCRCWEEPEDVVSIA